ncbi:MAG: potassium channel family protein, partial [Stellaceae bacterium]
AMIQVSVDQIPSVRADVQAIRANFYETMFHNEPVYNLSLEPDEANKMENYLLGFHGRSASFSYNIVRMVYLSAVVQTTLGLGDLIPMTTIARGMVTFQAIFGIVFAGLFINASTRRSASTKTTQADQRQACRRRMSSESRCTWY